MPIRVVTLVNLINKVNPISNYTFTMSYIVSGIKLYTSINFLKC